MGGVPRLDNPSGRGLAGLHYETQADLDGVGERDGTAAKPTNLVVLVVLVGESVIIIIIIIINGNINGK